MRLMVTDLGAPLVQLGIVTIRDRPPRSVKTNWAAQFLGHHNFGPTAITE